jgi:hypothetical protein
MIRPVAFGIGAILAITSPLAANPDAADENKLRLVSGYLNAFWEYPNFLPDSSSGLKIMAFQLRETRWQRTYARPLKEALIRRSDETVCFHIIGEGFVAPLKATAMRPWEGSQFIFVKVKKLQQLTSDAQCAARMNANLR